MELVFKNKKIECLGLLAWSIFTVSTTNLTYAFTHNWIFPLGITQSVCGLLFLLCTLIFHEFQLKTKDLSIHIILFSLLVQVIQYLFNTCFILVDERPSAVFYLISFFMLFITSLLFSFIIKLVSGDKK